MKRIPLTDGTGRWFDRDVAESFDEARRWNGNNHISLATGTQWDHEILYRTKGGKWILHHWSQWQGSGESYVEIDNDEAAAWLVRNERESHKACESEFAALQVQ